MDEKFTKLAVTISVLSLGLFLGYLFRKKAGNGERISEILLKFVIIFLTPFINFLAIWGTSEINFQLILLPITGFILTAFLFIPAFVFPGIMKYQRKETGSFILCTLISNVGYTMGGFICFVFLGNEGYALAAIYVLYGMAMIYTIAFPLARFFGSGDTGNILRSIRKNFTEPITIIPILGLILGFVFHFSKISYPAEASSFLKYLIPAGTFVAFFAVGMKISLPPLGKFIKPLLALFVIKFVYSPFICQIIVKVLSLNLLYKKVIFIESMMPVGIYALMISILFKLDEDISKAGWIYTTIMGIILIPVIFYGLKFFG